MKALLKICYLLLISFTIFGCKGDFDGPPVSTTEPPKYEGPEANMTIAEFRDKYQSITTATEITEDYIIGNYIRQYPKMRIA